jgi:predicted DsbA family dithiol-disulfide isomerase
MVCNQSTEHNVSYEAKVMTIKIDLYTDIVCPWCLIGTKRLNNVLQSKFSQVDVEIEHHPVLLNPDCPPEGVSIADLLTAKFGKFDPQTFFARAEAEARGVGIALNLAEQPPLYPTTPGHTLIRLARPLGTQHRLSMALASAYFLDRRNIGDLDVLADVASAHGFSREQARLLASSPDEIAATRKEAAASAEKGVTTVPHLLVNGVVTACQDEGSITTAIQRATTTIA